MILNKNFLYIFRALGNEKLRYWRNMKIMSVTATNVSELHSMVNHSLDDLLVRWITECNNRIIGLSGTIIQKKARKLATDLGMSDSKAAPNG